MKRLGNAVRVKKCDAQKIKNELKKLGMFDTSRAIGNEGEDIYLPVLENTTKYPVVQHELSILEKKQGFSELLANRFGKNMAKGILSSYDVIGDIAIVQIPKELSQYEKEVGKLLLKGDSKVKVVMKKAGGRKGEFRISSLEYLAGEHRSETEYTENKVRMKLDITKVYFSPRLSNERKRLTNETKAGEDVLVLFAGVGPFALEIGKMHPDCNVVGIELNPDAVGYFEKNILLNKLKNVEVFLGDVKILVKEKFENWADRIAMPLPMGAEEFLDSAFLAAKSGCTVHFYKMVERNGGLEQAKKQIEKIGRKHGKKIEFLFEKEVRPYSVSTIQVVIDFRII